MKRVYAAFVFVFTLAGANAQLKSGQLLAGGGVSYKYQTVEYNFSTKFKFSQLDFSPSIAIFAANKVAAGLRISLSGNRSRYNDSIAFDYRSRNIVFSPFGRYYFLRASAAYNLFIDAAFDYHVIKDQSINFKSKYYGEGFSVSAGPVIFITPQIAIELALGYFRKNIAGDISSAAFTTLAFKYHFRKR